METNYDLNAVHLCKVMDIKPLFRDGVEAERIEQILLVENDYSIVAQKGLYSVGDTVVYIEPDYNLPDTEIFKPFTAPNGDPKKSILGRHNRIRAKKFNFYTTEGKIMYSIGILLPLSKVSEYYDVDWLHENPNKYLGVYKRPSEEPTIKTKGGKHMGTTGRTLYETYYKTDETNIHSVRTPFQFPIRLIGSLKIDGSSTTTFYENTNKKGMSSRQQIQTNTQLKCVGYKPKNFMYYIKRLFGIKTDRKIMEVVTFNNKFINLLQPYLDKLEKYCVINNTKIALRGEAFGQEWGGGGSKNNPHKEGKSQVLFFGSDEIINGITYKMSEEKFSNLITELGFERTPVIFDKIFNTKEELYNECDKYFEDNMVEGIVIRDEDTKNSYKYMNPEYDAKK